MVNSNNKVPFVLVNAFNDFSFILHFGIYYCFKLSYNSNDLVSAFLIFALIFFARNMGQLFSSTPWMVAANNVGVLFC